MQKVNNLLVLHLIPLLLGLITLSPNAISQSGYYLNREYVGWTGLTMTNNSPATGIISNTSQATSSSDNFVVEWDGGFNKWYNTNITLNTPFTFTFQGCSCARPDSRINTNTTNGKFYTLQIRGLSYSDRQAVLMETDNSPQSFHSTPGTAVSTPAVYPGQDASITVTLAGAKSSQERVFIRYSTNNFATSSIVEATGTGSAWTTATAIIPSSINTAGTQVRYYAYTTTVAATNSSDHDLITLKFGNNGGSNYTYTVASSYTPNGTGGNWSSGSTWNGGIKPASNQPVVITSGTTVTLDENISTSSLTINSGAIFIASDASARTITISRSSNGSSTTLSNSGTWQNGSGTSTIVFTGAPSSGDAIHNTSGTIPFQNIVVNKTSGSSNVGLAVGAGGTISGTLEIGTGGFVSAAPPTGFYLSTAILKFNQGSGAIYDVNSGDFSWSTTETPDNITISSGTVRLNGNRTATGNLLIDGGALSLNTGNPTLTIQGNWTRSSGTFTPNSGTVILSGASNSAINIDDPSAAMYNLTIDKSGGANVTLNNNLTITNALTLSNGSLILGSNNLTIGSSGSISITSPSASKMIVASGAGKLIKNFSTAGAFTFPVGDNTGTAEYSPITLNFTTGTFNSASASVSLVNAQHPSISTTDKLSRYWAVTTTGVSGFNCSVSASYLDADIVGNENNLWSMKHDGSSWTYGTQVNAATNTLTFNTSSFSDFTAGNNITLPVTFTSLTGSIRNGRAQLSWNIADEVNVDHYEVEESADGRRFQALTQVDAASRSSYQATDAQINLGANYYRVKAVDIDGKLTFSKVIRLDNSAVDNNIRVYPNPSQGELTLGMNIAAGNYQIRVINAVGQTVFQQALTHEGGSRSLPLTLPKLNAGIYQVEVRGGLEKFVKSLRIE